MDDCDARGVRWSFWRNDEDSATVGDIVVDLLAQHPSLSESGYPELVAQLEVLRED